MEELKIIDWQGCAKREKTLKESRLKNLTWDILIYIDPHLDEIYDEISKLEYMNYRKGRELWRCKYKPMMLNRVGYGAPEYAPAVLKSAEAYRIVYSKWYNALMQGHDSCGGD